jgi:uncharacterized membrane protein YraQ (UPF0718 family)
MNTKKKIQLIIAGLFILFITVSFPADLDPGRDMASNFWRFLLFIVRILPCVFILIGLFEVWVPRETIERHFGAHSGIRAYLWPLLIGATTVGGLFVAFPVAHSLQAKGARKSSILVYLGASTVLRVPMTMFEASFLGLKFTIIRMAVALPLIILSSILLEKILGPDTGGKEAEKP